MPSSFSFITVPLDQVEPYPDHLPLVFGSCVEDDQLLSSVKQFGILNPLMVVRMEGTNHYCILDGHRRYVCAKKLGHPSVECQVLPSMDVGEYEHRRFILHHTTRRWTQAEHKTWQRRMKTLEAGLVAR